MFGLINDIYSYFIGPIEAAAMPVEEAAAMPVEAYIDLMNNNDKYKRAKTRLLDIRCNVQAFVFDYRERQSTSPRQKDAAFNAFLRFKDQYRLALQELDRKKEVMDARVYEEYGFRPR